MTSKLNASEGPFSGMYLVKKSRVIGNVVRWFLIRGTKLLYFQSAEVAMKEPRGFIELAGATLQTSASDKWVFMTFL